MQKSNFRYEAVVHDDASNDGTANIIREYAEMYPDIIKPIYESQNVYSQKGFAGIFEVLRPFLKGKYVAFCEGDDFWTDEKKLQKQVDFMDNHSDIVLTCHRYNVLFQESSRSKVESNYVFDHFSENDSFEFNNQYNLCVEWLTKTPTVLVRNEKLDLFYQGQFKYGRDVHMIYCILNKGNAVCMSFNGATYRRNETGVFGSLSSKKQMETNILVDSEFYKRTKDPMIKKRLNKERFLYKINYKYKMGGGNY